jgi:repressor LexA
MQRKVGKNVGKTALRIRELREEHDETQEDIGKLVHLTYAAVGKWERGESEPSLGTVNLLAAHWGISVEYLTGASDVREGYKKDEIIAPNAMRRTRVYGTAPAGEPLLAVQEEEEPIYLPDLIMPRGESFALRVRGDSMVDADLHDGEYAVFVAQDNIDDDEIAAVIVNGDEATIKRIGRFRGWITLYPENKAYRPSSPYREDDVHVLGKLVGKYQKL